MIKYDWNVDLLREIVKECINFGEVLERLQIPKRGNNTKTLKEILDREQIDYSHFTGRAREYAKPRVKDIEYYLTNQGYIKTSKLKERLLKEGLKENKCEICGIKMWNEKPLIIQLHHINGNSNDNRLENLQMLCPNCHSQTENYCGNSNEADKKYYCPDCGKEISKKAKYCSICSHKHQENSLTKCPSLEQFIEDFKELKGFSQVGRKYNVSDNSVKKWAQKFNLPYHTKELLEYLNKYSIEEIKNNPCIKLEISQNRTKYNYNLILKLIDLKYTTSQISNYIGCSKDTVKAIGSKYKHSIRKSNIKSIKCYKNNELIKICFGKSSVAHWLYNDMNYKEYSINTLENMIIPFSKKGISINNINLKIEELPNIEYIINNKKEEELFNLYYIKE